MKKSLLTLFLVGISSIGMAKTNPWQTNLVDYGFRSPFKSVTASLADYCTPSLPSTVEAITLVSIGEINNPSPKTGAPGYEDFTSLAPAQLKIGDSYEIKFKGDTGGNFATSYTVFIDYNQDGVFDANERTDVGYIQNSTGEDDLELLGSIVVSEDALVGETRMRVLKRYTSNVTIAYATDGCTLGSSYGQIEDYTVNILPMAGCLAAPNGLYPTATFSPNTFDGTAYNVTTAGWTGEYSNVKVKEGFTYTFSTAAGTQFITVGDAAGENILKSGVGSVTWKADRTDVVRFYTHLADDCTYSSAGVTRVLSAVAPVRSAADNCTVESPSNNFENGGVLGGTGNQELAFHVNVAPYQLITGTGVKLSMLGTTSFVNFEIYNSDASGLPGELKQTLTGTITENVSTGTAFNLPTFDVTATFSEDAVFNGDESSRYWVKVLSDAAGIESTTSSPTTVNMAFKSTGTTGLWRYSTGDLVYQLESECSSTIEGDECNQSVASNNLENGSFIGGDGAQKIAFDISVGSQQKLTATGIDLNLFDGQTYVNFELYSSVNDAPGELLQSVTGVIESSTPVGTAFGYPVNKVSVSFASPIVLDGANGTRYWLSADSDAIAWESTSTGVLGLPMAFSNSSTSGAWQVDPSDDLVYTLKAICEGDPDEPEEPGEVEYCIPEAICSDGDNITNVTFQEINNTTDCESANGYSDYTAMKANVEAGGSYQISVTVGAGWTYETVMVWIDFDKNGVFDTDEYFAVGDSTPGTQTGTIAIPADVANGEYRMRVRNLALNPNHADTGDLATYACSEAIEYGEIEDYTLVVGELGVSDLNGSKLSLYPNPVKDVLNISSKTLIKTVEFVNIAGQVVATHKVDNAKAAVNVSSLTAGVYVVRTTDVNGKVQSYKVIKK